MQKPINLNYQYTDNIIIKLLDQHLRTANPNIQDSQLFAKPSSLNSENKPACLQNKDGTLFKNKKNEIVAIIPSNDIIIHLKTAIQDIKKIDPQGVCAFNFAYNSGGHWNAVKLEINPDAKRARIICYEPLPGLKQRGEGCQNQASKCPTERGAANNWGIKFPGQLDNCLNQRRKSLQSGGGRLGSPKLLGF